VEEPSLECCRRRAEAGFTFIEVTIASIMLLMLAYLVATLSVTGMDAQKYAERMARVTEITQDVVDEIRSGLATSVRVFTDDAVGTAYLALCDRGNMPTPLGNARLPRLSPNGQIERDTSTSQKTGNVVTFARYAWTDEFQTSSGSTYRVDVHRIEIYFLTPEAGGPRSDRPDGLNLSRWVSEPIADATQVDAISDATDRAEVLLHLLTQTPDVSGVVHARVELVWKLGDNPAVTDTLRQIDSTGGLSSTPISPRTSWAIQPAGALCSNKLYYRHHSVATNFASPVMGGGRFAIPDATGAGFPHGLETQVVGPASARQVLLHLTVVSTNNGGHRAFYDMQVVVDVRDL
jgi:type II secretory pathway pseudopilin PulG